MTAKEGVNRQVKEPKVVTMRREVTVLKCALLSRITAVGVSLLSFVIAAFFSVATSVSSQSVHTIHEGEKNALEPPVHDDRRPLPPPTKYSVISSPANITTLCYSPVGTPSSWSPRTDRIECAVYYSSVWVILFPSFILELFKPFYYITSSYRANVVTPTSKVLHYMYWHLPALEVWNPNCGTRQLTQICPVKGMGGGLQNER